MRTGSMDVNGCQKCRKSAKSIGMQGYLELVATEEDCVRTVLIGAHIVGVDLGVSSIHNSARLS